MSHTTKIEEKTPAQPWILPETLEPWLTAPSRLEEIASRYSPISLAEMDSVSLLNRTDTKFLMPLPQLLGVLESLTQEYQILAVHGQRLNHYQTLYFDTPDFNLFHLHVNGRADQYKVRSREYIDSGDSFLEVKHKTSKGRTIKCRIPTPRPVTEMTMEAGDWLDGVLPFSSRQLQPKLWNTFTRITLVSKPRNERVTLDVDLTFLTPENIVQLNGLAIAEVKMNSGHPDSPFVNQMHQARIHPCGFSKYCIGVSMLFDHVKKNALKSKILSVEKMIKGSISHE